MPSAAEMEVELWPAPNGSYGDSARLVKPVAGAARRGEGVGLAGCTSCSHVQLSNHCTACAGGTCSAAAGLARQPTPQWSAGTASCSLGPPTRQAALLADGVHLRAPPRQHLVDVRLVPHIPNELVLWRVEHIVQRQAELHHAQAGAQVPARLGHGVDQVCGRRASEASQGEGSGPRLPGGASMAGRTGCAARLRALSRRCTPPSRPHPRAAPCTASSGR